MLGQRNSGRRTRGPTATAVWAFVAAISLATAATASLDREGRSRLAALFEAQRPVQLAEAPVEPVGGTAAEIARLKNETRMLALEKKALSIRLAMLEDGAASVTGSIGARRPSGHSAATSGDDEAVEVKITDLPVDGDYAEAQELVDPTVLVSEVAGVPAPVRQSGPVAGLYSLEIGTASTMEEARSIWAEFQEAAPEASEDLVPLIAMDDRNVSRLWVMVGRFASEERAEERCAVLDESGAPCAVTERKGRPLPLP